MTSDGTTLLGADDKARIAEIMAAVAYLARSGDRPRAIRVAFTVDEEVGRGAEDFDLDAFGADVAYARRLRSRRARDRDVLGRGRPRDDPGPLGAAGTAKGKLVNAVKLASELVLSVPRDRLSPETIEDRGGYVHHLADLGLRGRRPSSTSSHATTTTTCSRRTSAP